jgi:hypothetical protein
MLEENLCQLLFRKSCYHQAFELDALNHELRRPSLSVVCHVGVTAACTVATRPDFQNKRLLGKGSFLPEKS